jgi:D-alanyl-D-alanine carboxypeptidase (penicillin-binding protein 5/6)
MFTRLHFSYWKLFTFVLILSLWSPSIAVFAQSGDLQLDVKSAILIEASTGQILYQINADQAFPPASMSKMMTEYLVMEAVTSKKIKWEDIVTASKYASEVIGSGQLIAEGEQLAVRGSLFIE